MSLALKIFSKLRFNKLFREYAAPSNAPSENESGLEELLNKFKDILEASSSTNLPEQITRKPIRPIADVKKMYVNALYQDGVENFKQKKFTNAVPLFERAAFFYQEDSDALVICYHSLASAYFHLDDFYSSKRRGFICGSFTIVVSC